MLWPDRNHERGMQAGEVFIFELGLLIIQCPSMPEHGEHLRYFRYW